MPRKIEEELLGYRFQVRTQQTPDTTPDGAIRTNGNGEPKTQTQWLLEFIDPTTQMHIVRIPLNADGKDAVIQGLTGGLSIAQQMPNQQP